MRTTTTTPAGYRTYDDADVERLHFVLVYRAAGLRLDEIAALLDDPEIDIFDHLRRQHALLLEQDRRLYDTITALEKLMDAHRTGIQLTAEEQVEIFGTTAFSEEYAEAAQQLWGDTDAWKQSQQRTAKLTKADWRQIKAENDALLVDLAAAKRDGVEPGSSRANALARRHRDGIERFYDCDDDMHSCLADMYVADERFTRYYDDVEPGLARFVRVVILASHAHVDSGA